MTASEACKRARALELAKAAHMRDGAYIDGLERAVRCLHDLPALIRYVRDQVPEHDVALRSLLTRGLLRGCDAP